MSNDHVYLVPYCEREIVKMCVLLWALRVPCTQQHYCSPAPFLIAFFIGKNIPQNEQKQRHTQAHERKGCVFEERLKLVSPSILGDRS